MQKSQTLVGILANDDKILNLIICIYLTMLFCCARCILYSFNLETVEMKEQTFWLG